MLVSGRVSLTKHFDTSPLHCSYRSQDRLLGELDVAAKESASPSENGRDIMQIVKQHSI